MILEHKQAVVACLKTDQLLAACGFEGVVPPDPQTGKRPQRYWTFFTDSGRRYSDRLGGTVGQALLSYTFHWVGSTPEQAQRLAERGVSLLAGHLLTVPGWSPFRIRHVSSTPTQMDDTVKPPLHFLVDQFEFATQPG